MQKDLAERKSRLSLQPALKKEGGSLRQVLQIKAEKNSKFFQ